MTAKKVPSKGATKNTVKKAAKLEHPLKVNGKEWDRQKTADFICARIASSSKSIAKILAAGYGEWPLPDYTTFMQWLREDDSISHQYARAKDDQADFMADETLEIADEEVQEPLIVDGIPLQVDGKLVMVRSNVAVQHAKLRVDARKWLASKLKPKKYGDRTTLAGDAENPVAVLTMEQITTNPNSRLKVK
ncbi:MAG TPA: hypothetical protein VK149_12270 [Sideroxyarcus sp.]|nr:hypothetical protein [Sideroxyarcus sp.]